MHSVIQGDPRPNVRAIQTWIVLQQLEQALATRLLSADAQLPAALGVTLRERVARRRQRDASADEATLADLLAETYLQELMQIAVHHSEGTPQHELFRELLKLCDREDVWSIRNACAHPNRPFEAAYWYRVAALAHAPCLALLDLHRPLLAAVRAAEDGTLDVAAVAPPSDAEQWRPAHNLPQALAHRDTGLIGRHREIASLHRALANARHRAVALVGPSGAGKTSLLLEGVDLATRDARSIAWVDAIVYVSAKHAELTAAGPVTIGPVIDSIASLRTPIVAALRACGLLASAAGFDAIAARLGDVRVLLCIDNLESVLLREPQALALIADELPIRWRLLASSQLPPDGAFNLTVGPLDDEAARRLAREYARTRGLLTLGDEELDGLSATWEGNPLAIRLAVDAYRAGASLGEAVRTTREAFLEHAYGRLLELLGEPCRQALECLFAADAPQPASAVATLAEMPIDVASVALLTLARTSLVERVAGRIEDAFRISDSIRALLLRRPADPALRLRLPGRLRATANSDAEAERHACADDPYAWNFVSPDETASMRRLAGEAFRLTRNAKAGERREDMLQACGRLDHASVARPGDPLIARCRHHLLLRLGDRVAAAAAATDVPADVAARDAPLMMIRARVGGDPAAALEVLRPIYRVVDATPDAHATSSRAVAEAYYTALDAAGLTGELIAATAGWRTAPRDGSLRAARHVLALLRQVPTPEANVVGAQAELIGRVLPTLDEALARFAYDGHLAPAARRAISSATGVMNFGVRPKWHAPLVRFFGTHLRFIVSDIAPGGYDTPRMRVFLERLAKLAAADNPFARPPWRDLFRAGGPAAEWERKGYLRTVIDRPWPQLGRPQLFSRDVVSGRMFLSTIESMTDPAGARVGKAEVARRTAGDVLMVAPDWSNGWSSDQAQPTLRAIVLPKTSR